MSSQSRLQIAKKWEGGDWSEDEKEREGEVKVNEREEEEVEKERGEEGNSVDVVCRIRRWGRDYGEDEGGIMERKRR